jgi:hypothetical protein
MNIRTVPNCGTNQVIIFLIIWPLTSGVILVKGRPLPSADGVELAVNPVDKVRGLLAFKDAAAPLPPIDAFREKVAIIILVTL